VATLTSATIAHVPAKQYVASYYHTFSPTTFVDFQLDMGSTNRPPTTFNGNRAKGSGGRPVSRQSLSVDSAVGVCLVPSPGVDQFAPGGEARASLP